MKVRNRALGQLGAALALCLLAGACTQAGPQGPTPAPTPASTSPSETQLERQTRLDFEAAEKAYRANMATQDRAFGARGVTDAERLLGQTSAGEYLAFTLRSLRSAKKEGWHTDHPTVIVAVTYESYSPSQVTLIACEDNRQVRLVYRDGKSVKPSDTRMYVQELIVKKFGALWKVTDLDSEQVKSFANQERCAQ